MVGLWVYIFLVKIEEFRDFLEILDFVCFVLFLIFRVGKVFSVFCFGLVCLILWLSGVVVFGVFLDGSLEVCCVVEIWVVEDNIVFG